MKFEKSKANFKELGKDFKAIGSGLIGAVVGTVKIPVCLCKDFRNMYLESKQNKEVVTQSTKVTA